MMKLTQLKWLVSFALITVSSAAFAGWDDINLREGVTQISREVYDLHMLIFVVCCLIGVVVFGVMIVSMLMHRKSLGHEPADFHDHDQLEILWTVVPIIILVAMAIPATTTLNAMYDPGDAEIDIEVRGYQWKWQYTYLDDDPNPATQVKFMSNLLTPQDEIYNRAAKREHYLLDVDNPLVIPTHTRIRFLITAEDVIHAWWVPDFAVKKDAVPGFIHESWAIVEEPGIYRGQCAELCGKDHGFMPVVVHAVERAEYDSWLAEKKQAAQQAWNETGRTWSMDELMTTGEEVYLRACAACHQVNGQGLPPAFPSLVGQGISVGDMSAHIDIVLNGKSGTAMQAFAAQLSPSEIAAVVTYERNAWGNDMGDSVQPSDINSMLTGQ